MRILLLIIISLIALPIMADVYRSVDEDGNVLFSDQPSEGAEKIKIDKVQTIDPPDVQPNNFGTTGESSADKEAYSSIAIASPGNKEAISSNNGDVSVFVSLTPELEIKKGHKVVLYLDGKEVKRNSTTQFQLQNVDRGTHSLSAGVTNANGIEIKRSDKISFTVHRFSTQHQAGTIGGAPDGPAGPTGGVPSPGVGVRPGPTGGLPSPGVGASPGPTGGLPGPGGGTTGPTGGLPAPAGGVGGPPGPTGGLPSPGSN